MTVRNRHLIETAITPELEARLVLFQRILDRHDRVALTGPPRTGKSLFQLQCTDGRRIVHTDDFIVPGDWAATPRLVNQHLADVDRFLLIGIRAKGCVREGLAIDMIVWLDEPIGQQLERQANTIKGRRTSFSKFIEDNPHVNWTRI